jgi:hypothetical protein
METDTILLGADTLAAHCVIDQPRWRGPGHRGAVVPLRVFPDSQPCASRVPSREWRAAVRGGCAPNIPISRGRLKIARLAIAASTRHVPSGKSRANMPSSSRSRRHGNGSHDTLEAPAQQHESSRHLTRRPRRRTVALAPQKDAKEATVNASVGLAAFPRARGERGIVLLVVLGLLQLLALTGIAFATLAAERGHVNEIGRVQQDIERAQTALSDLLEAPNDADLQGRALLTVDHALQAAIVFLDGWDEPPTPETRRLHGFLTSAGSLLDHLVTLLRNPDPR